MRLDKFLSHALQQSRKDVIKVIQDEKVVVNGVVIKKKDYYINEEIDVVYYDNNLITYRKFVYYMLNKPQGVVSAVKDEISKTVVDLIKERKDVFPVGRLDKDTEGLLILTNNGTFAHKLTSPNYECEKTYFVQSSGMLSQDNLKEFALGIEIKDQHNEIFKTAPAKIEEVEHNCYLVSITEGKFHQVKRMFAYFGYDVLYLKRISHGGLMLDPSLQPGEYRELTDEEVLKLKDI